MRIIHSQHWSASEIESYRQLAFANVLDGMRELLIAMRDDLHIEVADGNVVSTIENNQSDVPLSHIAVERVASSSCCTQHRLQCQRGGLIPTRSPRTSYCSVGGS